MDYLIIGILSYLLGSIPFGYLFTKLFLKKDIRDVGSGNIGATNALRSGNKLIGYLTLVFDIGKAFPISNTKVRYPINLLPDLRALVAPIFPDPTSLISFFKNNLVNKYPKGIDPKR